MRPSHPDLFVLPQLPSVVGDRYELTRRIGIGGAVEVFLAWDRELGREVAVKRLRADRQGDVRAAQLLRDEAKALATLRVDPMTEIFDIQTSGSDCYLVLRHIAGRALDRVLSHQGGLLAPAALQIAVDVVDALLDQHARGLVHQAVTPTSILVDDTGHALLLDLGDVHECGACRDEAGDVEGVGTLVLHALIAAPLPADRRVLADLAYRLLPEAAARVIARAIAPRGERYARLVDLATALRAAIAGPHAADAPVAPAPREDSLPTIAMAPLARGSSPELPAVTSVLAPSLPRRARPRTTRGRWQILAFTGAVAIAASTAAAGTSQWLAADAAMTATATLERAPRPAPMVQKSPQHAAPTSPEIEFELTADDLARAAARPPVRVITIPPRVVR